MTDYDKCVKCNFVSGRKGEDTSDWTNGILCDCGYYRQKKRLNHKIRNKIMFRVEFIKTVNIQGDSGQQVVPGTIGIILDYRTPIDRTHYIIEVWLSNNGRKEPVVVHASKDDVEILESISEEEQQEIEGRLNNGISHRI